MKVEIRKFDGYKLSELEAAAAEYLTPARLKRLQKAKTILIKPNCLGAYPPERAVTTHPLFIESVIIQLLKLKKKVWIGDSPGGSVNVEQVWETTGLSDLAQRYPIKLINLSTYKFREFSLGGRTIQLSEVIWDCDGIINIAKYKTHSLMAFTGAIKNLYGLVPGMIKSEYHKDNPDTDSFSDLISDIYSLVKDRIIYNVIDGIEGMDGAGPSAGRKRQFNLAFGSVSASALDHAAARLMGFKLQDVPYLFSALHTDGILPSRIQIPKSFENYTLSDVDIQTVKIRKDILKYVPGIAAKAFKQFYYYHPVVSERCQRCGVCVKSCPVKAISWHKTGSEPAIPVVDPQICIKCMCCHEMCTYRAIDIKKSFLAKMVMG